MIQEASVERCVVGDQHRIADEVEPLWCDFREDGSPFHHFIPYPGTARNKTPTRALRISQLQKLVNDPPASNSIRAKLNQSIRRSFRSGCFHINNDEVQILK